MGVYPAGSRTGVFFVGIYRVCVVDVERQATFEGVLFRFSIQSKGFFVAAAKWLLCEVR